MVCCSQMLPCAFARRRPKAGQALPAKITKAVKFIMLVVCYPGSQSLLQTQDSIAKQISLPHS